MSAWTQVKGDARPDDRRRRRSRRRSRSCPTRRGAAGRATTSTPPTRGADPGRPVETAFTQRPDRPRRRDLPHARRQRDGRVVGGYSMGGYGAIRYSIAHPDLFVASIVLSPAVYNPMPPADSSAREFGAFGKGSALFVDSIYRKLNYPAELRAVRAKNLPSHMFIAVGDDEYQNPSRRLQARPRLRVARPLQAGRARAEPVGGAARAERRPRLERLGPGVRGGREVRVPVRRAAARSRS